MITLLLFWVWGYIFTKYLTSNEKIQNLIDIVTYSDLDLRLAITNKTFDFGIHHVPALDMGVF